MGSAILPVQSRMSSEERRQHLIRTAIQVFSKKGLRGTTTRELAEAAGVCEALLYRHFKSKDEFYDAIIDYKSREARAESVVAWDQAARQRDDRAVLVALGWDILRQYEKDPAYIRLLLYSALEKHELSDKFFHRQVRPYYEFLIQYFRDRIEEGAFRKVDPAAAAMSWYGMVHHFGLVRNLLGRDFVRRGIQRTLEEFALIFLKGITAS